MSGHSKWAGIKHKKAAQDKKRGKLFSKLSRAITVAAREGGGDPDMNATLAQAIQTAKDANMPIDIIARHVRVLGCLDSLGQSRVHVRVPSPFTRRNSYGPRKLGEELPALLVLGSLLVFDSGLLRMSGHASYLLFIPYHTGSFSGSLCPTHHLKKIPVDLSVSGQFRMERHSHQVTLLNCNSLAPQPRQDFDILPKVLDPRCSDEHAAHSLSVPHADKGEIYLYVRLKTVHLPPERVTMNGGINHTQQCL